MGIKREVVERYYDSQGIEYKDVQSALRAQFIIDCISCLKDYGVARLENDDYMGIIEAIDPLYNLQVELQREVSDAPPVSDPVTDADIK